MDVKDNHPWLWKRLHGATDREALELSTSAPVLPTDAIAGHLLAVHRTRPPRAPTERTTR